ncbi:hypothetical protein ACUN9Y_19585 [Halomonas sp. V046]|uniref:hypothetical protein n=1 Tax=Halomonas sp. V046 TaxID=3459611 RepID=UPI004044F95E
MSEHDFELTFTLPEGLSSQALATLLENAGCHDVLVGGNLKGLAALHFSRQGACVGEAMRSAMHDVILVEPRARLLVSR